MPLPHDSLPQNSINYNFLINQIASGLSTTTDLIKGLSHELKENSIELAIIKTDLNNVIGDVNTLSKILKDGNGEAPVLSRIAVIENTIDQTNKSIDDINQGNERVKAKVDDISNKLEKVTDNQKIQLEDRKSRRSLIIAVITSIIALISTVAVALLS